MPKEGTKGKLATQVMVIIMRIKEAAARTSLTEKAIRLYEEKGLITPDITEINGRKFRDYSEETVKQLETIAKLRKSFFTVSAFRNSAAPHRTAAHTSAQCISG